MKTTMKKIPGLQHKWYVIDARGQTLGRLATRIATLLQGKHKPEYLPHQDTGDYIIVINARDIVVTGNKLQSKMYHKHSGYIGGLRSTPLFELLSSSPETVIENAVCGMLPKNKLRKHWMKKLKVFAGSEHTHEAQKPEILPL